VFHFNKWFAAFACLGIVLSAAYMLSMVQKTFYGKVNAVTERVTPISGIQRIVLFVIVISIIVLGIYPEPVIHLTESAVTNILNKGIIK